jgi:NTE family protein
MTPPRIGLALGSGSAHGWAHIGVIEALGEAGVEADVVCGTSIGALVGAAYVTGRLAALKEFALALGRREIVGLLDMRLPGGGLIEGDAVVEILRKMGVVTLIENLSKPYAAIATDLTTGREIWLREGPIHEAVRASISLPGIFNPVHQVLDQAAWKTLGRPDRALKHESERWLVDGGLVNPVPVSTCRALGADIIIAVNLNGDGLTRRFARHSDGKAKAKSAPPTPELLRRVLDQIPPAIREQASAIMPKLLPSGPSKPGYFSVIANSINIMQDQITRARLAGEPPDIMLMPRLRDIGLLEFDRAEEAIAEGRDCVAHALTTLRRLI